MSTEKKEQPRRYYLGQGKAATVDVYKIKGHKGLVDICKRLDRMRIAIKSIDPNLERGSHKAQDAQYEAAIESIKAVILLREEENNTPEYI